MVSSLRRAAIPYRNDPHDWNSWDNYRNVHDRRLSEHPFVVGFRDTLLFGTPEDGRTIHLEGFVECGSGVILQVTKKFDIRYDGRSRMYVRCHSYNYVGFLPSRHLLLKYHNLHADPDDYIHRVYDPTGGAEVFVEHLQRYQFPTFPEVLDELEYLAQRL